MREIKFRAWFNNTMIDTMSIQEMIHQRVNTIPLKTLNNEVIFMQYTGLKDKNGVEIYNKDIIRDGGRLWIVEISNLYGVDLRLLKDKKITRPYVKFEKHLIDDFEVIGNIYENSELQGGPR